MSQIILGNCYKKGAATVYRWCISVNVQKGGMGLPPSTCGMLQCKCTYLASINFVWFLFLVEYIMYMCLMMSSVLTMSRAYSYVV
jgi:hypothetical protein